jgi:hypothetical protein
MFRLYFEALWPTTDYNKLYLLSLYIHKLFAKVYTKVRPGYCKSETELPTILAKSKILNYVHKC